VRLNKRERVKLLAATYQDACEPDKGEMVESRVIGHKDPRRSSLWDEGSYWELERAMGDLYTAAPFRHRWFKTVYVVRTAKLEQLAAHKRHRAEQGMSFVVARTYQLAGGNVYVPEGVALLAGFSETEARAGRKPRNALRAA
jgi:hypothetical protein